MVERDQIQGLVVRAKEGDRKAFDELAGVFRDRLRSSLRSWSKFQLGPKLDLDDLLQETFLRAYRTVSGFEWQGEDSFLRWLCGIAKHALAQAAREARKTERKAEQKEIASTAPSPSQALRRHERRDRLEEALKKLSPEHREVILLCRLQGLTSTEVAARMNRSPAAIRQLLVRALKELKGNFGDTESLHLPDRDLRGTEGDDGK